MKAKKKEKIVIKEMKNIYKEKNTFWELALFLIFLHWENKYI